MSVFGQYILTSEAFEQLCEDIASAGDSEREIEQTTAFDKVRERSGMMGIRL